MAYFADSCNIMMFALVFNKPHDAVVGLCGFLPALSISSALQVITVLAVI